MAGLLAVDGHIDVQNALPVLHALGDGGHPVGDLLVQQAQHFLPDNLRGDDPLGLVGEGVLGKEVPAGQAQLFQLVQQIFHAAAVLGGDRHHRLEPIQPGVLGDLLHNGGLVLQQVGFVDGQHRRHLPILEAANQLLVGLGQGRAGLCHQQAGVHAVHRAGDGLDHVVPQGIFGLDKAGGIQKHQLVLPLGEHAHNAGAGGLGLAGHNGNLLSHQPVEHRGLAHVGPAHNGDKRRALLRHSIHITRSFPRNTRGPRGIHGASPNSTYFISPGVPCQDASGAGRPSALPPRRAPKR